MKNRLLRTVILLGLLGIWAGCGQGGHWHGEAIPIPESAFEKTVQGKPVSLYTLRNERGMLVQITNYGPRVVALWAPGAGQRASRRGVGIRDDRRLPAAGAIDSAARSWDATETDRRRALRARRPRVPLTVNDGANHLHGGSGGFADKVWDARPFVNRRTGRRDEPRRTARRISGNAFDLGDLYADGRQRCASTTGRRPTPPTVLNPTSHVYFNLNGTSARESDRMLTIHAGRYTPTDGG
ncbi:MAG: hypothetical protein ACLTTP_04260 [Alistipes ihumii]